MSEGTDMKIDYLVDKRVDLAQFLSLYRSVGWTSYLNLKTETIDHFIRNSTHTIQAFHREKLVGFGRTFSDGVLYVLLQDIMVSPDYQRKGIGTTMVNRLLRLHSNFPRKDLIRLFAAPGSEVFYSKIGLKKCPLQVFQEESLNEEATS